MEQVSTALVVQHWWYGDRCRFKACLEPTACLGSGWKVGGFGRKWLFCSV